MKKIILLIVQFMILQSAFAKNNDDEKSERVAYKSGCPIEDDPANLARCIQFDASSVVLALKGNQDFSSFCALGDRYMECVKTYTRGCIGYFVKFKPISFFKCH